MKAYLKTTFERYGKRIVGHIEDAEMYEEVKNGTRNWKEHMYSRITHIEIPKDVYERLLEIDRGNQKQSEGMWEIVKGSNGKEKMVCTNCRHQQDLASTFTYCPNCGARMKGVIYERAD